MVLMGASGFLNKTFISQQRLSDEQHQSMVSSLYTLSYYSLPLSQAELIMKQGLK